VASGGVAFGVAGKEKAQIVIHAIQWMIANVRFVVRIQWVDPTHALNRSAGVS